MVLIWQDNTTICVWKLLFQEESLATRAKTGILSYQLYLISNENVKLKLLEARLPHTV